MQFFTHYTDDNIALPAPALYIVGEKGVAEEGEGTRVDFKYELNINEEQCSEKKMHLSLFRIRNVKCIYIYTYEYIRLNQYLCTP